MLLCYVDGKFVKPEEAVLPISDLIIQRGVGVFEALATINQKPLMLTPHLTRFINSAKSTGITNIPDVEEMKRVIREGIAKLGRDVRVRTFLTGGDAFNVEKGCFENPRFFAIFDEAGYLTPEEFEKGWTLEPVSIGRNDPSVKNVDYRMTFKLPEGVTDVLYCPGGEITECGHSNFFLVLKDGTVVTAPLSRVLKGTTRTAIIELAQKDGLKVEERCPLWSELASDNAAEAFITGSIKMVVPIVKVGGITLNGGKPGNVTRRLSELYKKHLEQWLE
ncbi:MAG: aminotransferase class IV family protein [Synergistaceae bacterium]|nr:aminotransferase class IV family protein [Synergistaceae bacterium]